MADELRVLLVDDNPLDRGMIRRELRDEFGELQFLEVTNQAELDNAIESEDFEIVITDYQIRWTNGLAVLREVRQRYENCPVVMFTATGNEEIAVEAMKAGLNDYVIKNMHHIVRLRAAVRAAIENASVRRRAAYLELRLQNLLAQLKVGAFSCTLDGRFLELNEAMRDILGCKDDSEALNLTLSSLFQSPLHSERFLAHAASADKPQQIEIQRDAGTSSWRVLIINARGIESAVGQPRIDGIVEDVTEVYWATVRAQEAKLAQSQIDLLSVREKQILNEVVAGGMNKTIARQFDISEKTVERLRSSLMKKLQVRSVAELVRLATIAENLPNGER